MLGQATEMNETKFVAQRKTREECPFVRAGDSKGNETQLLSCPLPADCV